MRKVEHAVERKTRFACRCRPFRGVALALFALFGGLATAAQAMLLTLDLRWTGTLLNYNLQEGSIIQVIGIQKEGAEDFNPTVDFQFGDEHLMPYGTWTGDPIGAAPYTDSGHAPATNTVWLADNTQTGHEILYTGAVQQNGSWYGLYTQITVDDWLYNTVYIRVFGATDIAQGVVTASYWGVSTPHTLQPTYHTDTLTLNNFSNVTNANYFEVIPEPATLGLLGLGGVALAAWRRRRFARTAGNVPEREED